MSEDRATTPSLGQRLHQIAQSRAQIDVAQLQVINLEAIAAGFGHRWPAVKHRVFETAVHFLKKRIGEGDTLIPCSDGFIIMFGEAEGQAAEHSAHQLVGALNKFFVGDDELAKFKISCTHRSLDVSAIESFIQTLSDPSAPAPVQGTLPAEADPTPQYSFRYRPVFDVKNGLMTNYFAEPVDANGDVFDLEGFAEQPVASRRAYRSLDLANIEASVRALRQVMDQGGRVILGVTIHCETLSDVNKRQEVLGALARIDPQLRRYLMLRLRHVPPGFPRFHLDEHIRLLVKTTERVGIDLSLDDPNTEIFSHPAIWAFGFALPAFTHYTSPATVKAVAARLRQRAQLIHKLGKRLAVSSNGGTEALEMCREAEADFVSALGLWPLMAAPRGVQRPQSPAAKAAGGPAS